MYSNITSTFADPLPEALEMKFMMCFAETVLPAPLSPLKIKPHEKHKILIANIKANKRENIDMYLMITH